MVKTVFVVALMGLFALNFVSADDLKCYICNDGCDSPKDTDSQTCKEDNLYTTEAPPTTTEAPPSSTEAPQSSTTPSTTTSSSVDNDSTSSSDATTEASTETTLKEQGKKDGTTDAPVTYKCFKLEVKDSENKTKIQRGCTTKSCTDIEKDKKGTSCDVCDSENCNPASNIQSWAFTSVALIVVVKMLF